MTVEFTAQEMASICSVKNGAMFLEELSESLIQKLFDFFIPTMPYGIAKARTGDPYQYISDHLDEVK